ncbi:UvrABC system protein C [Deltaproteobacteria bacterium]|nr:UvrABC system protein C [Deltaproteobacteria bacterium]
MDLQDQADTLPTTPGVYLFKDVDGEVLYVGKATNLRSRVRQYLSGHDERFMVRYLVAAARRIEVVPVGSEKEALLLENSLIKQHMPRYNVKLRDDKAFLRIRLDSRQKWARLTTSRRPKPDGARYFGPYPSATSARRTLAFIQRHFRLRTCTDRVLNSRSRPCLLHQMNRCVAPCVGLVSEAAYAEIVEDAALALAGKNRELVPRLRERMGALAEAEDYEGAARMRDVIQALSAATQKQVVADSAVDTRDTWGLYREADRGVVACLPTRGGQVLEPRAFPFEGEIGDDGELLSAVLNSYYEADGDIPGEVLLPVALPDAEALAEVLRERRGGKVRLVEPRRGDGAELLTIITNAARSRFLTTHSEADRIAKALAGLAEIVGLDTPPWRIECYDNSNLLGEEPVASQVVFVDGRPAKKEYRRYHVKTVGQADDYATMREILGRRLRRAAEESEFPDLIVVDGGRGQLSAALDVLRELGLEDQAVIGLSKPRTEHARGDRDATDKIILPGRDEPILLRPDNPTLRLLQHIRDEAHRFAIGFHRDVRSKARLTSQLDEIAGIGKARRVRLLKHFGSFSGLQAASVEQIATVEGFGPTIAARVYSALHPPRDTSPA